jgi:hypothetical protein
MRFPSWDGLPGLFIYLSFPMIIRREFRVKRPERLFHRREVWPIWGSGGGKIQPILAAQIPRGMSSPSRALEKVWIYHCEPRPGSAVARPGERSDEAISQPIEKENDSSEGKGNRFCEKPDCFVGFDENPKTSKPARNDTQFIRIRLSRNWGFFFSDCGIFAGIGGSGAARPARCR